MGRTVFSLRILRLYWCIVALAAARGDLLVVGSGPVVRAYRIHEKRAPGWYNPAVAALFFTLVIAAMWRPLLRLQP